MAGDRRRGRFTIRLAGLFFLASAVLEVASVRSEVALLGAVRGGAAALVYHLVYIVLFAAMGGALWWQEAWAPTAVLAGTALYSIDRLSCLLIDPTLGYGEVLGAFDAEMVRTAATIVTVTSVACWWGFAGYVYLRRDLFRS